MEISPTSSVAADSAVSRIPIQSLGQADFLKLLVAQMTSQDPLNPQKDTEFIAQMAQFSALEQAKSMQSDIAQLRADQELSRANAMLGRTVELQLAPDLTASGTVSAVQIESGTPKLVVNGEKYELSQVIAIAPDVSATSTPTINNYAKISQLRR